MAEKETGNGKAKVNFSDFLSKDLIAKGKIKKPYNVIVIPKNVSLDSVATIWKGIRDGIIVADPEIVVISVYDKIPKFPGKKVLIINVGAAQGNGGDLNVLDHHFMEEKVCSIDLLVNKFNLKIDEIEKDLFDWIRTNDLEGTDLIKNRSLSKFTPVAEIRYLKTITSAKMVFEILYDVLDSFYASENRYRSIENYHTLPMVSIMAGNIVVKTKFDLFGLAVYTLLSRHSSTCFTKKIKANSSELLVRGKKQENINNSRDILRYLVDSNVINNEKAKMVWQKICNQLSAVSPDPAKFASVYDRMFNPYARIAGAISEYGYEDATKTLGYWMGNFFLGQYDFLITAREDFEKKTYFYKSYSPILKRNVLFAVSESKNINMISVINAEVRKNGKNIDVTVLNNDGSEIKSRLEPKERVDVHVMLRAENGNQIHCREKLSLEWVKEYWLIEELFRQGKSLKDLDCQFQSRHEYLKEFGVIKEAPHIFMLMNKRFIANRSHANPNAKLTIVSSKVLIKLIIAGMTGKAPKYYFSNYPCFRNCANCQFEPYKLAPCFFARGKFQNKNQNKKNKK
jgi:hypothetical protein